MSMGYACMAEVHICFSAADKCIADEISGFQMFYFSYFTLSYKAIAFELFTLSSGSFFLTPAAEKTKTQGQNSSQKLKKKTEALGSNSSHGLKLKEKPNFKAFYLQTDFFRWG